MRTHLILGPNRNLEEIQQLQEAYKKIGNDLSIHGDGINQLTCKAIKLANHDRIMIFADGGIDQNDYFLDLCGLQKTSTTIKKIVSNNVVHIELLSCHGGAGINSIDKLAVGSTLITLADKKDPLSTSLIDEVSLQIANLPNTKNPFSQFIYYLALNPDLNKFAIKTKTGTKIFSSSVNNLNKYSLGEIKHWQKKQLSAFAKFCNEIQKDLDQENENYVSQVFSLLGTKDQILDNFDTSRYRELLLINMARNDNVNVIEDILESGIHLDCSLKDSTTAISLAAKVGHINVIELLLKHGSLINGIQGNIFPLYNAALGKNLNVIDYLLSKGANIDQTELNGVSSLSKATMKGNLDVVEFLWSKGAQIDSFDLDGTTPLIAAANLGYFEIVKFLYSKNANIDKVNNQGQSAIFAASAKGNNNIVEFLCTKNVNINIQTMEGATPLIIAAQQGKYDVVTTLTKANANLEHRALGVNALVIAGLKKDNEIVKILLAAGADTKIKYQGKTLLEWNPSKEITSEIKKFDKDPVKYILQHNEQAKFALNAIHKVEHHSQLKSNLLSKILQTEECLEAQNQEIILHLNDLCGINGS